MDEISNHLIKPVKEHTSRQGIRYTTAGAGRPVILTHGMAASRYDWNAILPNLTDAGYQVYAPDLLGHGDSYKPEDPYDYTIETLYSTFDIWIDELQLDMPALLVGHSLGGYLSLLYARRRPERVDGLTLIDPFYSLNQLPPFLHIFRQRPEWGEKAIRVVPGWLIEWFMGWDPDTGANFSPYARRQIANDYKRASPHFVYIIRQVPDLTPVMTEINTPALVIWGSRDRTLNPGSFPRILRHMPNASGFQIPNSGHQPHIGRPELVSSRTLGFFASL